MQVLPKCYNPKFLHHLGADQYYYPCCFVRVGASRNEFKAFLGKDYETLNIAKYGRKEIMKSPAWRKLYISFYRKPLKVCRQFCPLEHSTKFSDPAFEGVNRSQTYSFRPSK